MAFENFNRKLDKLEKHRARTRNERRENMTYKPIADPGEPTARDILRTVREGDARRKREELFSNMVKDTKSQFDLSNDFDTDTRSAESTPFTADVGTLDVAGGLGRGVGGILTSSEARSDFRRNLSRQAIPSIKAAIGESSASLIEFGGEQAEKRTEQLAGLFTPGVEVDFNSDFTDNISDDLRRWAEEKKGESVQGGRNAALERYLEGKPTREEQDLIERLSDPEYIWGDVMPSGVASYAPVIAAGIAGSAAGGPVGATAAAFGTGSLIEGGAAMSEAKYYLRTSDDPALQRLAEDQEFINDIGIITGIGAGALEATPVGRLLGRSPVGKQVLKQSVRRFTQNLIEQVARGAGEEGVTESFQEILGNSVAQIYNENQDLFEGVPEAFLAGSLLGGGMSTVQATSDITRDLPAGLSIEDITDADGNVIFNENQQEEFSDGIQQRIESLENKDDITIEEQSELRFLQENQDNPVEIAQNFKDTARISDQVEQIQERVAENQKELTELREEISNREGADIYSGTLVTSEEQSRLSELTSEIATDQKELRESITEFNELRFGDFGTTNEGNLAQQRKLGRQEGDINESVSQEQVTRAEISLLKDRIRNFARGVRTGRREQRQETGDAQTTVISILEDSGIPKNDIAKFRRFTKNIQTRDDLQNALPELERRIDEALESDATKEARARVKKALKSTKPKKSGGKTKGKLTPELQEVMDSLRELSKLNVTESRELLQKRLNDQRENGDQNTGKDLLTPEEILKNQILAIGARDDSMTAEEINQFADDIESMINEGRAANERSKFNLVTKMERRKEHVKDKVRPEGPDTERDARGKSKEKTNWKTFKNWLKYALGTSSMDFHGFMHLLDSRSSVENMTLENLFNMLNEDNRFKELQSDMAKEFVQSVSSAYGIEARTDWGLLRSVKKRVRDLTNEEVDLGKIENGDGNMIQIDMTRAELIKLWMELQDPTLEASFREGAGWGDNLSGFREAVDDAMKPQDVKMGQAFFQMFQKQYDIINEVYKEMYGVNLPRNPNYSPIKRKGYQVDATKAFGEFLEEQNYRAAISPAAIKERTANALPIERQSVFTAWQRQSADMNYFVAFGQKIRELSYVFSDPEVRDTIKDEFGDQFYSGIMDKIDQQAKKGTQEANALNDVADFLRKNFTIGQLALKPQIAFKQTLSIFAYLENLSAVEFTAGIVDFMKNPIKNARILKEESVFIRTRGENIERDIKFAMEDGALQRFKKSPSYINMLLINVRAGDVTPILLGSWAIRKKALKEGVSKEEAIRQYEEFGSSTQQSSDISRLSTWQNSQNPMLQLLTMFQSSQNQYFRKEAKAIMSLFQKDGLTKKNLRKVGRTMAIYHFILPMIFQFAGSLMFLDGIDEEDRKDLMRAGILGSFNGLFLINDLIDNILRMALDQQTFGNTFTPFSAIKRDVMNAFTETFSEDGALRTGEVMEAIEALAGAGTSVTGQPFDQMYQLYGAYEEAVNGSYDRAALKAGGWSDYVIDNQLGEDKSSSSRSSGSGNRFDRLNRRGSTSRSSSTSGSRSSNQRFDRLNKFNR